MHTTKISDQEQESAKTINRRIKSPRKSDIKVIRYRFLNRYVLLQKLKHEIETIRKEQIYCSEKIWHQLKNKILQEIKIK